MVKGISIYLQEDTPVEVESYLKKARRLGFNTVFTSIHIPELQVETQIAYFFALCQKVKEVKMELLVDVSGEVLSHIVKNKDYVAEFIEYNIMIRFDCGYETEQILLAAEVLGVTGLVLNASTLKEIELNEIVKEIREHFPNMKLLACHNFYPRVETGLAIEFVEKQGKVFEGLGIPVLSFLPSIDYPRGPMYQGLVTVESHRHLSFEESALMLYNSASFGGLIIADVYAEEKMLKEMAAVCENQPLEIQLEVIDSLSENEKEILFSGEHQIRYDSGAFVLRVETSRAMATLGRKVEPKGQRNRSKFDVTIDNEKYGRYSGELQIVLDDLRADERVNVVGYIAAGDQYKLEYIKKGKKFVFGVD